MTVSHPKGDRGKADRLFSRLIRSRGFCMCCGGDGPFDTAHIIGRRYSATRCVEDNAWCLCRPCHMAVDEWPKEKMDLVKRTIGEDRYVELCLLAQGGIPTSSKLFWAGEVERLTERCKELGLVEIGPRGGLVFRESA